MLLSIDFPLVLYKISSVLSAEIQHKFDFVFIFQCNAIKLSKLKKIVYFKTRMKNIDLGEQRERRKKKFAKKQSHRHSRARQLKR